MVVKLLVILWCCIFFQSPVTAQETAYTLEDLAWLSGCWENARGDYERLEYWMRPSGGMMVGVSHTVVKGETVEYEFLQIVQKEDGAIYYIADPSGQKETSFKLVLMSDKKVIFENPGHDFPQRIIYRLENDGSLTARIEGLDHGQKKSIDFPMKRLSRGGEVPGGR